MSRNFQFPYNTNHFTEIININITINLDEGFGGREDIKDIILNVFVDNSIAIIIGKWGWMPNTY